MDLNADNSLKGLPPHLPGGLGFDDVKWFIVIKSISVKTFVILSMFLFVQFCSNFSRINVVLVSISSLFPGHVLFLRLKHYILSRFLNLLK